MQTMTSYDFGAVVLVLTTRTLTTEDIHRKAESLGIIWDYDQPGSRPFLDHSVRLTGETHQLQSQAIQHTGVPGPMIQPDGMVGRCLVQIPASRVPLFSKVELVVA